MAQINKPSEHFNTKLYTGTGASSAKTGVGFQPDLVWIKQRSGTEQNAWFDSIRGATKYLSSNMTSAEATTATTLTSFDSDGFTEGGHGITGNNNSTYVSWCFKGGGTAVSNTDGTITSNVSANTTAGFSIVSWTGSGSSNETVGHGLSSTPTFIILKPRSEARNWLIWSNELGDNDKAFLFDTTVASDNRFGPNAPTSSVFGLYGNQGNRDGTTFIAYCFHDVKGYSKFGKYVGNNSADGTFVYTGFSPAFVLIKNTSDVAHWMIQDNKRSDANGDNPANKRILPSNNIAEATDSPIDLLSNGFKIRSTGSFTNDNGNNYIYMAFAEQPLVGTNNIPATAR